MDGCYRSDGDDCSCRFVIINQCLLISFISLVNELLPIYLFISKLVFRQDSVRRKMRRL